MFDADDMRQAYDMKKRMCLRGADDAQKRCDRGDMRGVCSGA